MTSRNSNNYSAAESYKVAYEFEAMRSETRLDRIIATCRANVSVYLFSLGRFFLSLSNKI